MKNNIISLLCLPFFGLGWWLDSLIMGDQSGADQTQLEGHEPTLRPQDHTIKVANADFSSVPPDVIQSPEDLLSLVIPRRPHATTARLKRAVETLSVKQLADFAVKLEARSEAHQMVIERWIALDPIPAIESAMKRDFEDYSPIKNGILEIFKKDRATAVRLLALYPQNYRGDFLITRGSCIRLMEGESPQDALKFIMEMDLKTRSDVQAPDAIGQFGSVWAKTDAVTAVNWALAQPPGHTRGAILEQMAETWGGLDASAAMAFLEQVSKSQLPTGSLRERLLNTIKNAAKSKEGQPK